MPTTLEEIEKDALKDYTLWPRCYTLDHVITEEEETVLENLLNSRNTHYQYVVSHKGLEVAIRRKSASD